MSKRMIMGIAAGVVAGATVIGVPAIAIAAGNPSGGTGAPAVESTTNFPGTFQQMQQWMSNPQHVQQMQQWMDDPQHVQQMQQWMRGLNGGAWSGMHSVGGQATQPTP